MIKNILFILIAISVILTAVLYWKRGGADTNIVVPPILSTELNLSNQNLTTVPSYVFTYTNVEYLDLSGNNLTGALPGEIRHLSKLKSLNLSNNNFTGVPAEIGQLRNLEILDLSNNAITGLPLELGNLSNLKTLILSGNQYSTIDLEKIQADLPETTEIIR